MLAWSMGALFDQAVMPDVRADHEQAVLADDRP
jgi:hypothetical protein